MKNSIKKNQEFKKVYNEKNSFSDSFFILYIYKNLKMESNRLGISVSKKVGNSVVRHKIKRRLREIFRINNKNLKTSFDLVIVCKTKVKEIDYNEMNDSFIKLCKKQKIFKEYYND